MAAQAREALSSPVDSFATSAWPRATTVGAGDPHPAAIVLGVDSPIGLTVVRDLGSHGVPVHGVGKPRSLGRASRSCTHFHERPRGPLRDWLPALIEATGAQALFAIAEADLIALAALPERIGGCDILTPRAEPLRLVLDKRRTLDLARSLGLRVPPSWQPLPDEDFAIAAAGLDYPAVVKWADPATVLPRLAAKDLPFVKAEFVADAASLVRLLRRYDGLQHWPLVQGYCPGVGFGQMINMHRGEATLVFQHRRRHEWPPEGGVSTQCEAVSLSDHREQMAVSVALLKAIGWEGPAMVEYRLDRATGRYWLMEVNGRFWGGLPLAFASGAYFAWEQYRRVVLDEATPAAVPRAGLRARYMIPETRRLLRLLLSPSRVADPAFNHRPFVELWRYLAGFFNLSTRYYVLDVRDPGPFFSDLKQVARKALLPGKRRSG